MSGYKKILSDSPSPTSDSSYKTMNLHSPNERETYIQQVQNNNAEQSRKSMDLKQKQQELQDERSKPSRVHLSIDDIQDKLPNAHPIHIKECYRIMTSEPTLTLEQAINVANGNGCEMDGFNRMCPSRPVENFRQKGNCVGDECNIKFNEMKVVEEYNGQAAKPNPDLSIINELKELNIQFYSSSRCGFCSQAKDLFSKAGNGLINSMNILENQKLPDGVRGYPHFHSDVSGKYTTGFPGSLENLLKALS
jgi:hypothetical protein